MDPKLLHVLVLASFPVAGKFNYNNETPSPWPLLSVTFHIRLIGFLKESSSNPDRFF